MRSILIFIAFDLSTIAQSFLVTTNTTNPRVCEDLQPNCDVFNICHDFQKARELCKKFCNLCDIVDGAWSLWGSWDLCDVTCGNGTRTRVRTCDNPAPEHGGDDCHGQKQHTEPCLPSSCPVHGGWSLWSSWGACSLSCGIGLKRRDRACDNPWPSKDGNHCFGDSAGYQICTASMCSASWTGWSQWTSCSTSCDIGLQQRTRQCTTAATSPLVSVNCSGSAQEYKLCQQLACYSWNQWENWSSCSSSCGTGLKQRARQCINANHESSNNCFGTPVQKDICVHNCSVGHGKEQSAFLANYVQNGNSTGTLMFANVMLNKGNDYNNNTGAFTCKIPGLYFFSVTLTKKADVDIDYITCYLQVNGQNKLHIYADPNGALTEKGSYSGTTSGTFHLNQNDTVQMGACENASFFYGFDSSFSGFLISSDFR